MLEIIYFSNVTNNTHKFVEKLGWESSHRIPIKGNFETELSHPYVLITPSYGSAATGHVPPQVKKFLANPENRKHCVGVIGSGNMNFGDEYAKASDVIAKKLGITVLYRVEIAGRDVDVENVLTGLKKVESYLQENDSLNIKKY